MSGAFSADCLPARLPTRPTLCSQSYCLLPLLPPCSLLPPARRPARGRRRARLSYRLAIGAAAPAERRGHHGPRPGHAAAGMRGR
ncbi:MAG: hypothetical protein WKG07_02605 [Hymenobacter sp.]